VLAVAVVAGLLIAFAALLARLTSLAFGPPRGHNYPVHASTLPIFAHLALVLLGGIYLPPPLVAWFQHVALMLG
jgi:hydrogenase-4 component F